MLDRSCFLPLRVSSSAFRLKSAAISAGKLSLRDDPATAGFIRKMQDSTREQQAGGGLAITNNLHDAKLAEASGPEKWLALKTRVAPSATEINPASASDAGLAYSAGGQNGAPSNGAGFIGDVITIGTMSEILISSVITL